MPSSNTKKGLRESSAVAKVKPVSWFWLRLCFIETFMNFLWRMQDAIFVIGAVVIWTLALTSSARISWWVIDALNENGQWDETILRRVRWGWVLAHVGMVAAAVWSTHAELIHVNLVRTEGAEWAPALPMMAWAGRIVGFVLFSISPIILWNGYEGWQRRRSLRW